jgi:16S rRNA (uracil1498-N3)-methyltransferase
MTNDWFYMHDVPPVGSPAELDEAEARHALGSRRLQQGDTITLFDGRGTLAEATIASVAKRTTYVEIMSRDVMSPPTREVTLASALPKGDRQAVMLSMAAQLGMRRFIPLVCERAMAKPGKGFESRTRRIFIEACKQSRQAFVPTLETPATPSDVARDAHARGAPALVADPNGCAIDDVDIVPSALVLMVGPEGGFTADELAAMNRHGAQYVSLGASILRTETAAVALLAWARLAR